MNLHPSDLVFLTGFIVYVTIRAVFERRARNSHVMLTRAGWSDRLLIGVMVAGGLLLPALHLFTPLLAFADYRRSVVLPWCGAVTMVAALWLFWRSHVDLGRNWSMTLELRKDHELIARGVYRRIRHPMYASIWLFGLAQGLLLANWVTGWSALFAFAVMYFVRVPREERMMLDHFGQEYGEYQRRAGRLCPQGSPVSALLVVGVLLLVVGPIIVLAMAGAHWKWFVLGILSWVAGVAAKFGVMAGLESAGLKRWTAAPHAAVSGMISAMAELLPAALLMGWASLRLPDALAFGAAIGAFEMLFVLALAFLEAAKAAQDHDDASSDLVNTWLFLLERFLALAGHVTSRMLVYIAIRRASLTAALLALVLFAIVDGVADYGSRAGWKWEAVGVRLRYYALIALVGLVEAGAVCLLAGGVPEWQT